MAIYPASPYEQRRARLLQIGTIGMVLLAVAVVIALIYLRSRGPDETATAPALPMVASEPRPVANSAPAAEPAAESTAPAASTPAVSMPPAMSAPPATTMPAAATPAVESAGDANDAVGQQIAQVIAMLGQQPAKVIEARDRLNELLPLCRSDMQRAAVKQRMAGLAEQWLLGKKAFPEDKLCTMYKVQPGDVLVNVGRQFNVPYEIIMTINGIERAELLQAGANLKIPNGPFHARVSRSTFTLDLYLQNTYVKSFAVGLGKEGKETPTGTWRVKPDGKLIKPPWTNPETGRRYEPEDPDYPLGSRWIGLEGVDGSAVGRTGFAIHGTKSPEEIGGAGSLGCIRLHNGDAVLMYNLLMPGASLVKVVD